MRALVTGGAGFVGAHLVARLAEQGWTVVATCRPGHPPWRLAALGVLDGDPPPTPDGSGAASGGGTPGGRVEVDEVDLAEPTAVARLARRAHPDVVFHLAASRRAETAEQRAQTTAVNTMSGQWLVDALPGSCRAVVRLGSSTEYAQVDGPTDEHAPLLPRGFFGATKAAGSLLVAATAAQRGLPAVILRAFQVYGPLDHHERFVPAVLRAARDGSPLALTEPGMRRDWIYVDDVVEACLRAASAAGARQLPPGQVLNLGTGRQVANEELVELAARVTGRPVVTAAGAHPGRAWDTGSWVCDPRLAAKLLGWRTTVTLEEGLARCWSTEALERQLTAAGGRAGAGASS